MASEKDKRRELPEGILILDGAMGSELDRKGVDASFPLWSANAMLHNPELLKEIHRNYLLKGATAITTNTFRTHERICKIAGVDHLAEEMTRRACAMAIEARDAINPDALVMGDVATLERCYAPELAPDYHTCKVEHRKLMKQLLDCGVDFLLLETMCAAHEAIAAAEVAEELAPGYWGISFRLKEGGSIGILQDGTPLDMIIDKLKGASFIGINCMDGQVLGAQIKHLKSLVPDDMKIAAYGNIGHWELEKKAKKEDMKESNEESADVQYARLAKEWIESGATIVGGCCGTSPDTIAILAESIKNA